jgi:hypothetical protein
MTQIVIEGELAERLLALAAQQYRSVEELLSDVTTQWEQSKSTFIQDQDDPEERIRMTLNIIGIFAGPENMSSTVSETMKEVFADKSHDPV